MKEDSFARVLDYVTASEATSTHFWLYRISWTVIPIRQRQRSWIQPTANLSTLRKLHTWHTWPNFTIIQPCCLTCAIQIILGASLREWLACVVHGQRCYAESRQEARGEIKVDFQLMMIYDVQCECEARLIFNPVRFQLDANLRKIRTSEEQIGFSFNTEKNKSSNLKRRTFKLNCTWYPTVSMDETIMWNRYKAETPDSVLLSESCTSIPHAWSTKYPVLSRNTVCFEDGPMVPLVF